MITLACECTQALSIMPTADEEVIAGWTTQLEADPSNVQARSARGALYLERKEAVLAEQDAREWVRLQPKEISAWALLGDALVAQRRFDEAVKTFKQGLVHVDSNNEALQEGLNMARVAVLNSLDSFDSDDEGLSSPEIPVTVSQAPRSSTPRLLSPRNVPVDSISPSPSRPESGIPLTLVQLVSELVWFILVDLHHSSPHLSNGCFLITLGVFAWCMQHAVVLAVVVACLSSLVLLPPWRVWLRHTVSRLVERWLTRSSDKLYHVALVPCLLSVVPMVLRVLGLCNLFWFVHQDIVLAVLVFSYLVCVVASAQHPKLVKVGLHLIIFLYWVVYRQHTRDAFRFIPPASFELASWMLGAISPLQVHQATKRAVATLLSRASSRHMNGSDFPYLSLSPRLIRWLEFWTQPSTFTVDDVVAGFQSLHASALHLFAREIHAFRAAHDASQDDYAIMVAYIATTVRALPPSRTVACVVMVLQRCVHLVVFAWLLVGRGDVCFAILPLVALEVDAVRAIVHVLTEPTYEGCDTLDLLCMQSPPLLTIWSNVKAGVYCLEASVAATKVAVAATAAARLGAQFGRLASTVVAARREGVTPHMDNLVDLATTLYESRHLLQPIRNVWTDLSVRWWGPPSATT
ncbi:Aste57867_18132 [Aphanomyces stellatus]|uniref:Aste57867_18132 protein n=1 Tax=Aphanomyces stellatus TaxID=120398 RepID=A0A485LAN4_9STRA|nr:hypothetical protein As57867_018070 [Aphanomyces stellatus]VFT94870.1 Aste57867_18132 [Aphanomyces stellatus]